MTALIDQPAWKQVEALKTGQITSRALLEAYVERFQTRNRRLNAVIKTDIDRAMERASALDLMRAEGNVLGLLHGLPMTVKDTLDVASMPATSGAPEYAKRARPVADADVVERAKAAGAVIWGKTNVPYLAGDWQSFNSVFGTTNNPWDVKRTCGGSSGGSAAALASGMSPLEIGSDIGGSLRIPASFCGVVSLKPSYGVISQKGHVPPSPDFFGDVDLNVVGPMARHVKDLKLLRSVIMPGVMAGAEAKIPNLADLKIAAWPKIEAFPLAGTHTTAMSEALAALEDGGAGVSMAKPDIDPVELISVYMSLLSPIVAMGAPKLQIELGKMMRPLFRILNAVSGTPFTKANQALKATQTHIEWLRADARREAFKAIMKRFFERYDVLLMPVSPVPAFPHNQKGDVLSRRLSVDRAKVPYASHLTWIALATTCHLPVVTLPIGQSEDGLPIGMQIIGGLGEDTKLLNIAEAIEAQMGGFRRPPEMT